MGPGDAVTVAPAILDHDEHAAIEVVPGTYRVVIQRVYVPPEIEPAAFRRGRRLIIP